MYSFSTRHFFYVQFFYSFLLLNLQVPTAAALQVFVGAGTVPDDKVVTTCDDIQEFACRDPDTCDRCDGPNSGQQCRNDGQSCNPGDKCAKTPGHCIENTFCAPGKHSMPVNGTPKHFRCLSVTGLAQNENIVLYANNDYTGESCLVNEDGAWATPGNRLFNSVDTLPGKGTVQTCRKAGFKDEDTRFVTVGGYVQPGACPTTDPPSDLTCPNVDLSAFPHVNDTIWTSGTTEDGAVPEDRDDTGMKRLARRRGALSPRGEDWRASTSRSQAAQYGILVIAIVATADILRPFEGVLEAAGQGATALAAYLAPNTPLAQTWDADHIMELQLIDQFFNTQPGGGQWQGIITTMKNRECTGWYRETSDAVNDCNLVGIPTRLNTVKGILFTLQSSDTSSEKNPNFQKYSYREMESLQFYLHNYRAQFDEAVRRVGLVMDAIWIVQGRLGGGDTPPSAAFRMFAEGRLDRIIQRIEQGIGQCSGQNDDNPGTKYQRDDFKGP